MGTPRSRIIVATMKDEGPYILEWLAYHRLIGFEHFIVFSNDCWDTTSEILETVERSLGFVTHYDNTLPGYGPPMHADPQRRAYLKASNLPDFKAAEFAMVIDADEFLNIHAGNGTLDNLFAKTGVFDAMSLTWNLFGSGGVVQFSDDLVLQCFATRANVDETTSNRRRGVKTLFRPSNVEKIGVHRPFHVRPIKEGSLPIRWLNGAGEDQYEHYRALKWHATSETDGRSLAEINHYPIKSAEAFLVKARRGAANSKYATRLNLDYWYNYDLNETHDTSIQRYAQLEQRA